MYDVVEHTTDLRLNVSAPTLDDLFRESLRAMTECMQPDGIGPEVRRTIAVDAPDRTALLIDFLNEVLWIAHVHREIFDRATFRNVSDVHLEAELSGHRVNALGEDIKAVTYHEADVTQRATGAWETRLVFDI